MHNLLKEQLKLGRITFGVMLGIGSPEVPYALGDLGLDWMTFDMQHTVLDKQTIAGMIQAMSYSKTVPLIRVPSHDPSLISMALDIGAQAVIVPLVNTRDDAKRAVLASKYGPHGLRSYGGRAALRDPDYASTADTELMIIPQIETELAVQNVEEIATTEGVDAIFIGPFDLSMSLGVFGKFDSPIFQKAIESVVSTCDAHGVAPGLLAPTGPIDKSIDQGFKLISLGGDLTILTRGVADSLRSARARSSPSVPTPHRA